ncbi:MAG: DNA adenine methylase [Bacilli bacterium]|nr:DNA adenine methylase [Bacilli bacterium]
MIKGKPFVKWAGGKRQILDKLKQYIPTNYNCYYEPFIGGGALFFELAPKKAIINDSNKELMNVYQVLCDHDKYTKMCKVLNQYEANHSEAFYYEIRNKDKEKSFNRLSDYKKAARTLYLNKSCFNGLYRVNSKGQFNVPFNKNKKVNTYDGENLLTIHMYLNMNDVTIQSIDFEESVKTAQKGDFVYFDPPYDSDTKTFNSYTEEGFGKEEQRRLAKVFKELDSRGVYVMLSNHNTTLINELYKDYNIHIIEAKRSINSKGTKRGNVEELIITNYEIDTSFDNL